MTDVLGYTIPALFLLWVAGTIICSFLGMFVGIFEIIFDRDILPGIRTSLERIGARARFLLWVQLALLVGLFFLGHAIRAIGPIFRSPATPFFTTGLIGFALLGLSQRWKNQIVAILGAALVAAAFSHWIGPITFPK